MEGITIKGNRKRKNGLKNEEERRETRRIGNRSSSVKSLQIKSTGVFLQISFTGDYLVSNYVRRVHVLTNFFLCVFLP